MLIYNWINCYTFIIIIVVVHFVGGAVPRSTLLLAIAGNVSVFISNQFN